MKKIRPEIRLDLLVHVKEAYPETVLLNNAETVEWALKKLVKEKQT